VSRARRQIQAFEPAAHASELGPLIDALAPLERLEPRTLDRLVKLHPKRGRGLFRKSEIIAGFRSLGGEARFGTPEAAFVAKLRLRPVRSLSGVTPVTVLTRPHPCPGRCIFCPNDVRMPKSYLSDEPGAQRAEDNRFDPYLQVWNRLRAYREIGHPVEKIELIVLGGSWSAHPEPYQRWFVKRLFDALNDFGAGVDGRAQAGATPAAWRELPEQLDGRALARPYNSWVRERLASELGGLRHATETATWQELERAQARNEGAGARCVGLSLETRPDLVNELEALRMRRLGATKVQLGIQSLQDDVLARNQRGHDSAATRVAISRLRRLGFKIQGHWMPNLLGSTAERDAQDYTALFADPGVCPDELKLYPCVLLPSAELAAWYARGEWQPYEDAELLELLAGCLEETPAWCRLSRVIRDFSAHDIAAGSRVSNLREVAEERVAARGGRLREIRSREIRGGDFVADALVLEELRYETLVGEERFLQLVTPDDRIVGFLRLLLPSTTAPHPELEGAALVREVHVYGASLEVGRRSAGSPQHAGLGSRLVAEAAGAAAAAGYGTLAVIAAVGTRAWYRSLGFADGVLYPRLPLAIAARSSDGEASAVRGAR
jgi:elongator complex protein 3